MCTDGTEGYPRVLSFAGYVSDPAPQVGQVIWVHGVAINTSCGLTTINIELKLPHGARIQGTPECLLHNSLSSKKPTTGLCLSHPVKGRNGGLVFTNLTNLEANRYDRGYNSLEVRVPVVFDEPIDELFTSVTQVGDRNSEASVRMLVPAEPPPIDMMPGMPPPSGPPSPPPSTPPAPPQPTPSSTARGDDLMLVGSSLADAGTLPVAFSNDDGSFTVTNYPVGNFAAQSREPNVTRLAGDFDHDGNLDFALVGGAGWNFIPVAMAQGNGDFNVTSTQVGNFGALAASTGVKPVAGDFNGDGYTDIALVGGAGWAMVPIAFSQGDGTFTFSFGSAGAFPTWAQAAGARPIVGDFNRDGRSDIALVGVNGWTMLPHAYSNGDGTFTAHNAGATGTGYRPGCNQYSCGIQNGLVGYEWNFAETVSEAGAQVVAADFNHDGMTDIAVTGTSTSQGLRIAFSYGDGTFELVEVHDTTWAGWANTAGAKVHVGDFNKDGWNDFALTGVSGWNQLPMQLNLGAGTFLNTLRGIGNFGTWAALPGARVVVGDYNGDGFSDLAVTGVSGWTQIPVAMNTGTGFNILQAGTARFPAWTPDTSASLFVGRAN